MTMVNAFGEFDQPGQVDRALDAVVHTLSAFPALAAWTQGRIHRSRVFGLLEAVTLPQISVAALSIGSERFPSSELRLTVPVAISVGWEDFDVEAAAGEPGAATMIETIHRALLSNPFLLTPRYPGERLTERLERFAPVSLAGRRREGEATTEFALQLEAVYRLAIDVSRWERFGSA